MRYKTYILIGTIILSGILFVPLYDYISETSPAETADYNKSINIDNRLDNPIDIRITVENPEGAEIHNKSHYINDSKEIDNIFEEKSSDKVKNYNITAIYDDQTESSLIRTSQCFGDSRVSVRDDGTLSVTYSIC